MMVVMKYEEGWLVLVIVTNWNMTGEEEEEEVGRKVRRKVGS